MGQFEFGQNADNLREYLPVHAEVDWHDAYIHKHGDEIKSVWGETFDELGEFCEQLHQENTCFWLNDTNKDFDIIVVIDHRDESGDFWFSRGQIGSDRFDELLENIGEEVMVVKTKYPAQRIAEFVMQIMVGDIDK